MGDLNEKFASLEIPKDIFKDIKYFITGEVHEKVSEREGILVLSGWNALNCCCIVFMLVYECMGHP